jgi:toxin-antitoxin system PIN domain toxin
MRIVDANVLLYAVNTASEHHSACRHWLDDALSGADTVGMAWVPLLAFVRLTTKHGLFPTPLSADDAMRQVTEWCSAPGAVLVNPTPRHVDVLAGLLAKVGAGGNLVNDAHLAALAVEHRARIVSYDSDFSRFDGVLRTRPSTTASPYFRAATRLAAEPRL